MIEEIYKKDIELIRKNMNRLNKLTPCFILNKHKIRSNLKKIKSLLPGEILYSYKTNSEKLVTKEVLSSGCGFLLSSVEESVKLAKQNKINPNKLIFQSPSIKEEELDNLIKLGIHRFIVDSWEQVNLIIKKVESNNKEFDIFVRINTGIKIDKPELNYSSDSFLGFPLEEAKKVFEHIQKLNNKHQIKLGLHNHLLSQNTYINKWKDNLDIINSFVKKLKEIDVKLSYVDFGGGYPIKYDFNIPSLEEISRLIKKTTVSIKENFPDIKFIFEPGRKVVGESITLLAQITHTKKFLNNNIGILDCSVYNSSMDTLIVGLFLKVIKINNTKGVKKYYYLRGSTPDSLDVFSKKVKLSELECGDYLAFMHAGAYSFWSDFISLKKPKYIAI